MPEEREPGHTEPVLIMIIVGRVAVVLIIWLALFLAMFLGYFTVPILLVGALTLVYGLSDIGMFVAMRRQQQARDARRAFVRSQSTPDGSEQVIVTPEEHAPARDRDTQKGRDSQKRPEPEKDL